MPATPDDMDDSRIGCFSGILKSLVRRSRIPEQVVISQRPSIGPSISSVDEKSELVYFSPACDFSYGPQPKYWSPDSCLPPYTPKDEVLSMTDVERTINNKLDELDPQLRKLSLDIHGHPEVQFQERFACDILTGFLERHGFKITKGYLGLDTAWRAEYTQGTGGRVVGINSEMDALPGIGHACGHNLIAASGCGVAIALKAALEAHDIPGKIVLLGTPAEEGGGGKIILLDRGGYQDMDFCIMCHPSPGPPQSFDIGPSLALQSLEVEYFGKSAHAGGAPWEGTNALDAAFLAYSSLSVLRQQMKPDHRVHGTIEGKHWAPNVIPDYSKLHWIVRAPIYTELTTFTERVINCFEAAALATGCKVKLKLDSPYNDLKNNSTLAGVFRDVMKTYYGFHGLSNGSTASTDFGNVSYRLPSLHPSFAIPTELNGGNHTPAFARASATKEAHEATMTVTRGLALTSLRILQDDKLFEEMKQSFSGLLGSQV